MADVIIKLEGAKTFKKWLRAGAPEKPMDNFLDKGAVFVQQEAMKRAPVDTGRLRNSIVIKKRKGWRRVEAKAEYAGKVESGARPRWLPQGTLQPWARRHGFPSGALGDFLARYGVANPKANSKSRDGQPYMRPAYDQYMLTREPRDLKNLGRSVARSFKKAGLKN
jgi:hypothetical protein